MTIFRDGEPIILTDAELRLAYDEQQHKYDIEDVAGVLDFYCDGSRTWADRQAEKILGDPDWLSDIADQKRENMDRLNMPWNTATEYAVNAAMRETDEGE